MSASTTATSTCLGTIDVEDEDAGLDAVVLGDSSLQSRLPLDTLLNLKNALHAEMKRNNIYDQIRTVVGHFVQERKLDFSGEDKVLQALHQNGLIEDIVKMLSGVSESSNAAVSPGIISQTLVLMNVSDPAVLECLLKGSRRQQRECWLWQRPASAAEPALSSLACTRCPRLR